MTSPGCKLYVQKVNKAKELTNLSMNIASYQVEKTIV
jgi:hypothetical protein